MSDNVLPPVPYLAKMVDDNGRCTPQWAAFFRELWNRAGGGTGQSTTQLEATAASLATSITTLQGEIDDLGKGRAL